MWLVSTFCQITYKPHKNLWSITISFAAENIITRMAIPHADYKEKEWMCLKWTADQWLRLKLYTFEWNRKYYTCTRTRAYAGTHTSTHVRSHKHSLSLSLYLTHTHTHTISVHAGAHTISVQVRTNTHTLLFIKQTEQNSLRNRGKLQLNTGNRQFARTEKYMLHSATRFTVICILFYYMWDSSILRGKKKSWFTFCAQHNNNRKILLKCW